jgi:hypothetical protein
VTVTDTDLTAFGLKSQAVSYRYRFGMQSFAKVTNAICEDGIQRNAHVTAEADTFFSLPAKVYVKGKTVAGFLTRSTLEGWSTPTDDDPAVWRFIAYSYRKNGHLIEKEGTDND